MDALLKKPRREPKWKPATLEEVTHIAIIEKFFNTALEKSVRSPVSVDGGAVPRDSAEWAEYERRRKVDQLDLSLAGGFEQQQKQQQQQQQDDGEERKTSYALPTEDEIRAVLMRGRGAADGSGNVNTKGILKVGMTRKQLEMALKGKRPVMKLGLKERLDEVIGRKELDVEGRDRLVWRE